MQVPSGRKLWAAVAAGVVVIAVVVVGTIWLTGDDETEKRGSCGSATYEMSVEPEGNGLEPSFELQASDPGQTWEVRLTQNGKTLVDGSRTTDDDAELDFDAHTSDADGADRFVATLSRTGSSDSCSVTLKR